jgi:hypothetical protein
MKNIYIGLYKIHYYIYRPTLYEDVNLYNWICLSIKFPIPRKGKSKKKNNNNDNNIKSENELDLIDKNMDEYEPDKLDPIKNGYHETNVTPINEMKSSEYLFTSEHPQYLTYRPKKCNQKQKIWFPILYQIVFLEVTDQEHCCCTKITFFQTMEKMK